MTSAPEPRSGRRTVRSERQEGIATRLTRLGPGPALFFRDACELMVEQPTRVTVSRRAWNAITVEPVGNRPVSSAIQVFSKDPLPYLRRCLVDGQHAQPVTFSSLARVRVRPTV